MNNPVTSYRNFSAGPNSKSGFPPTATTQGAGTVLLFSETAHLDRRLRRALAPGNTRIQRCLTAEGIFIEAPLSGPICVVVDLDADPEGGLQFCEHLKAHDSQWPIIIAATNLSIRMAVRATRAGVLDIIALPARAAELREVVERALTQSRERLQRQQHSEKLQARWALLTEREREIIHHIIAGQLNKQIAAQLHLALVTIKLHRGKAMRKMGARSAAELVRLALTVNFPHPLDAELGPNPGSAFA